MRDIHEAAISLILDELDKLGGLPTDYIMVDLKERKHNARQDHHRIILIYCKDDPFASLSFLTNVELSFIYDQLFNADGVDYFYEYADPEFANNLVCYLLERIAKREKAAESK